MAKQDTGLFGGLFGSLDPFLGVHPCPNCETPQKFYRAREVQSSEFYGVVAVQHYNCGLAMCEKCRSLFPQDLVLAMNLPGAAYFSSKRNRDQGTAYYQDAEHMRRTAASIQETNLAKALLQTLVVVALADQAFDEAETQILQDFNEVLAGWKMQRGELVELVQSLRDQQANVQAYVAHLGPHLQPSPNRQQQLVEGSYLLAYSSGALEPRKTEVLRSLPAWGAIPEPIYYAALSSGEKRRLAKQ